MAALKQYINVRSDPRFVDAGREVPSDDQIGAVFLKVKLKKADATAISFRVVKVSEKSPYTAAEKKRCADFRLREPFALEISDGEEYEARYAAVLPQSGGAVYKMEARAGDKTVATTDEVESWRLLFCQVLHMKGISVPNLTPTFDYYKKLFIRIHDIPAGKKTEFPKLESATVRDVLGAVRGNYKLDDYEPWGFAVAFVDQLPNQRVLDYGVEVGTGDVKLPARFFGNETLEVELPRDYYFWYGFKAADDAKNSGKGVWLQSNVTLEIEGKVVPIPRDAIRLDKSHAFKGKLYNRLTIQLPEFVRNENLLFRKQAKLRAVFWVSAGFSGGWALKGKNLLAISSRSWFDSKPTSDSERLQILNHELGHKIGMVPKGGRPFGGPGELDAPASLYGDIDKIYGKITAALQPRINSKGHRGAHCSEGVKARGKGLVWKWSGKPKCTMFGATSTRNAPAPQHFCSSCEKLVMRLHLNPLFADGPKEGFASLR